MTDSNYVPSTLAFFYYQRAWSFSYSGRILGNMTIDEREDGYKDALAKISVLPTDPYVIASLFETKYRYALLLFINTNGRESDMRLILEDFGVLNPNLPSDKVVSDYFRNLQQTKSAITIKRITELAKISPEFKSFLVKLGWEL